MIKARLDNTEKPGKHILLIGLSLENMTRLQKGEAIHFNMKELGMQDQEVIVMGGQDESAIVEELRGKFSL